MTARADLLLGGAAILLGLVLAAGAFGIDTGFGYDRIGPRTAPYGVALASLLLGAALIAPALRARRRRDGQAAAPLRASRRRDGQPAAPLRSAALGWLVLAGLLFLTLAGRAGFIVAASLQFWLVARAFSASRPLRDGVVAVLLAATVYAAFSRGLGLALPASVLESLLF